MSETSDSRDDEWFGVLAGDVSDTSTSSVSKQAAAVRRALQARASSLDAGVPKASPVMRERLLFRLRRENLLATEQKRRALSGIAIAASTLLAVVLVADIALRLEQPVRVPASRGLSESNVWLNGSPSRRLDSMLSGIAESNVGTLTPQFVQVVTVQQDNPLQFVQRITAEAVAADVAVVVDKTDRGYRILVDGLIPESPDQVTFKAMLGITSSASGTVLFQVPVAGRATNPEPSQ